MDGAEGEQHPVFGAELMHKWFDGEKIVDTQFVKYETANKLILLNNSYRISKLEDMNRMLGWVFIELPVRLTEWKDFTLLHSRSMAKNLGKQHSKLCVADKFALVITPTWLQLLLMNLTGEIKEYMLGQNGRTKGDSQWKWIKEMKSYTQKWIAENK